MNSYLVFVIISMIIGVVSITPEETCRLLNKDCKTCITGKNCAFCKKDKDCFYRDPLSTKADCSLSDLQVGTCFATLQILAIVGGSVGGVILIAVIVIIVCLCRRCKRRRRQKEQMQENSFSQRLGDRRAAADIRSSERNQAADQIRMKYGLLKVKDEGPSYRNLS